MNKKCEIVEYWDQSGKLKFIFCYDHVEKTVFIENCIAECCVRPFNVTHELWKEKKILVRNHKGDLDNIVDTLTRDEKGNIKVTVGYV